TVIMAWLLIKEKLNLPQKVGILIAIFGIILLSL
ncbi:MAG: EamA family transporter, partial [Candidatus Micrarchaeota archaeon]|nr:EamA family transporter [Candidatus Micrarchaeota archaeon]